MNCPVLCMSKLQAITDLQAIRYTSRLTSKDPIMIQGLRSGGSHHIDERTTAA